MLYFVYTKTGEAVHAHLNQHCSPLCHKHQLWERSGSIVDCLTQDRGAVGSSLTGITTSNEGTGETAEAHPSLHCYTMQ